MKVVLDACVLYPSVLRGILLGVAEAGLFVPVWSERILEEWRRATAKIGPVAMAEAEAAAILMRARFPSATARAYPEIEARLVLPDPNDLHVLAVAVGTGADAILTFNAADFPGHALAAEGIERRNPDGFLWELWSGDPAPVEAAVAATHARAEALAGGRLSRKALLKRIRLNRLARAIEAGAS